MQRALRNALQKKMSIYNASKQSVILEPNTLVRQNLQVKSFGSSNKNLYRGSSKNLIRGSTKNLVTRDSKLNI